jgi:tetratricopeptide (TPR) repeat protein
VFRVLAPVVLLGALVFAAYGPALEAEFVAWDDLEYVTGNPQVQAQDPLRWLEIFDPRVLVVREWTPVVTATYILERHLLGTDPAIYHATNLLLQLGCALAALGLLRTLGLPGPLALGAAAWYAAHPLQVESVAWVAARKNLLSTLFFLLSATVYLRARSNRGRVGAFGLFLLAITSKATAVVLPAWLAALHLLRRDRPVRTWAVALAPFFVVGLARGVYSLGTQAGAVLDTAALGPMGRIAVMGPVLFRYARQAVWPADLALLYPWPELSFADARVLVAWAAIGLLIGGVVSAGRRNRRALELGVLVAAALFPTLNLFAAPFLQADRYLHLALVGVAGLLALGLGRLTARHFQVAAAVLIAWAVVWVPLSRTRTAVWQDSERLWRDALAHQPGFAPGHSNLGLALLADERMPEAIEHLRRAVELEPQRPLWRANLAAALVSRGDLEEGRRLLEVAIAQNPDLPDAHGTLAVIALREGRAEDALAFARRGAALRPGDPLLEVHVPEALRALGRTEEAARDYARIARVYPISEVMLGWADLERESGHIDRAEELYRRLLGHDPDEIDAAYNLATLRLNAGDNGEALRLYDRVLGLDPDHASAHNNRGSALVALGRTREAEEAYERAVALAPEDPRFKTNLANVLGATGRCNEALALYDGVLAVEPGSDIARLNRAGCLVQLGRRKEARPILEALLAEGVYRERVERLLADNGEEGPR